MGIKVVIIDPYSELPDKGMRLGRYHQFAKALISNGHNVKLYISNFSHRTKKFVGNSNLPIYIDNVEYYLIESSAYKSHISLSRIVYEKKFINGVVNKLKTDDIPDLIIIRDPAIFISKSILSYTNKNGVKYIVDIIDLWPELFELVLPKFLQKYSKYIFSFFYYKRDKLLKGASAYSAVAPDYLKIATSLDHTKPSQVIYWGCDYQNMVSILKNTKVNILDVFSLKKSADDFWLIYSGTLGDNYDIKSIFNVAETLSNYTDIKFIVAGSGPLVPWIKSYILKMKPSNIFFLGEVKTHDLFSLFKYCDIGLSTYSKQSTVSMPIKCYDYFAAGLPIINSLGRNLGEIVEKFDLGYNYIPEDTASLREQILNAYISRGKTLNFKKTNIEKIAKSFDQDDQYKLINELIDNLYYNFKTP